MARFSGPFLEPSARPPDRHAAGAPGILSPDPPWRPSRGPTHRQRQPPPHETPACKRRESSGMADVAFVFRISNAARATIGRLWRRVHLHSIHGDRSSQRVNHSSRADGSWCRRRRSSTGMNPPGETTGSFQDVARQFSEPGFLRLGEQRIHRTGMAVNVHGLNHPKSRKCF
jgi:hypothetical protein